MNDVEDLGEVEIRRTSNGRSYDLEIDPTGDVVLDPVDEGGPTFLDVDELARCLEEGLFYIVDDEDWRGVVDAIEEDRS